jgi:hypothetical protein
VEESDRGLISDNAPAFASIEASDRIVSAPAEIRTSPLPNRVSKRYLLNELARQKCTMLQLFAEDLHKDCVYRKTEPYAPLKVR